MRIRVIDYAANPGGGLRFAIEGIRGLLAGPDVEVDLVSHGPALSAYRLRLGARPNLRFVDLPAANPAATRRRHLAGIPLLGPGLRAFGLGGGFHFAVPAAAVEGGDLSWFPWIHSHRLSAVPRRPVVASLHDVIMLQYPRFFGRHVVADERRTLCDWLDSPATVVVSSRATAAALGALFGVAPERLETIRVGGGHAPEQVAPAAVGGGGAEAITGLEFAARPYLLCPANTSRHKNHSLLFDAVGRWGRRMPLVLSGPGTDLRGMHPSILWLRREARRAGLVQGESLRGLGLVDDATYFALVRGAWALVMPTLAEGGGSFPVLEALQAGTPVLCSDIPVLREMMDWVEADVQWFDPRDPESLRRALEDLERDWTTIKARALRQAATLRLRSWEQVGEEYQVLFRHLLARGAVARGG